MPETMRILLLEDNATDAELLQRMLKKEIPGSAFRTCLSQPEFLMTLTDFRPDLILADNSLPQFDAAEALRIVRQLDLETAFIMVSGTINDEKAVEMIKQGADDYVMKNSLARLPAAIESAVNFRKASKERKLALLRLAESEEKYRTMVERISDGFLVIDRQMRVAYINHTAESFLNVKPGSLLGKKLVDEFPGQADSSFVTAYIDSVKSGQNKYFEEYEEQSGKWLRVSIYPSPEGGSVFFVDITEQRRAEEEALQANEKYRIFIQRITDAFIALDNNWCYTYLNQQAGELIQQKPEEIIGKNVWELFPDAVGSATWEAFQTAMKEQRYITNTDYYQPLDLWQENHIYPSADGLSVFIRNITEKKKLEEALLEQQRIEQLKLNAATLEAQEKERNAIAIELHDNVNQILAGVNVFLRLLRSKPERSEELLPICIENMETAIAENRKIAHELVTPKMTDENLVQQLKNLCDTMLHPAGLETFMHHEDFDESRLTENQKLAVYRISQEQCTNIVKYAKARSVVFTFDTSGNTFTLRITDDGEGASENSMSNGIGLRNINSRLSVFGGSMQVQTNPGSGFELEITIPLEN